MSTAHDTSTAALVLGVGYVFPVLALGAWKVARPVSYERLVGGPLRRLGWRRRVRRDWTHLCETSGWTVTRPGRVPRGVVEPGPVAPVVVTPHLRRVTTTGATVSLVVRARHGQTLDELEAGVPRLASTMGAVTHASRPAGSSCAWLAVDLVMRDHLTVATTVPVPVSLSSGPVGAALVLGRTQTGADWRVDVLGRHTLVVGASGSGKGSVLWGVVMALAPAVPVDCVRLWGIDLKRGVELSMGAGLFSARAYTAEDALEVLRALVDVIERRGDAMAGRTRLHTPAPGDPLHVLIIDELAALTAYSDPDTRREADRLLGIILTQGRALGVSVVACVQDPRKEVVKLRGLFTGTAAGVGDSRSVVPWSSSMCSTSSCPVTGRPCGRLDRPSVTCRSVMSLSGRV